jgi:toxin CptA
MFHCNTYVLKPSRFLFTLLLLLHAGAVAITWWMTPVALALLITMGCLASWWSTMQRHVSRKTAKAIVKLWPTQDSKWELESYSGKIYSGELGNGSVRSKWFVLLNFKIPHKRFQLPVLIWRDALDTDSFRRLRVLLRFTF